MVGQKLKIVNSLNTLCNTEHVFISLSDFGGPYFFVSRDEALRHTLSFLPHLKG